MAMAGGDTERVFLAFCLPVIDADRFMLDPFLKGAIVLVTQASNCHETHVAIRESRATQCRHRLDLFGECCAEGGARCLTHHSLLSKLKVITGWGLPRGKGRPWSGRPTRARGSPYHTRSGPGRACTKP